MSYFSRHETLAKKVIAKLSDSSLHHALSSTYLSTVTVTYLETTHGEIPTRREP